MNPIDHPAPDDAPPAAEPTIYGARWAAGLGGALLLALALVGAVRWFGAPAATVEQIVQIPVADAAPTPRPNVLAPDPGDTP